MEISWDIPQHHERCCSTTHFLRFESDKFRDPQRSETVHEEPLLADVKHQRGRRRVG
jgi:hypothetical protein